MNEYAWNSTLRKPRKPMNKVGPRTQEWTTVRARLKRRFDAAGITSCELGYPGCWNDEALGFAHGRKRRHLKDNEIETLVVLACNPCHDRIETLPAPQMLRIVQAAIAVRGWS